MAEAESEEAAEDTDTVPVPDAASTAEDTVSETDHATVGTPAIEAPELSETEQPEAVDEASEEEPDQEVAVRTIQPTGRS